MVAEPQTTFLQKAAAVVGPSFLRIRTALPTQRHSQGATAPSQVGVVGTLDGLVVVAGVQAGMVTISSPTRVEPLVVTAARV